MENMENSDLYKYKYLQYKQDYLDLKDNLEGGRNKLTSYAVLYVILDVDSYNLMTTIIRRTILSINFIDSILTGSAFKIVEGSNKINFISNQSSNIMLKHIRRKSNSIVGISLPEYEINKETYVKSKSDTARLKHVGTMKNKYQKGNVYNNANFISKISNIIKKKLSKRDDQIKLNDNKIYKYKPITNFDDTRLPFAGIILFEAEYSNCFFIEAYKLEKTDITDNISNDITIATIENEPPLNVKLMKDPLIFNLSSPFMNIIDVSIDNGKNENEKN